MKLEQSAFFEGREWLYFLSIPLFVLSVTLSYEYYHYRQLTQFEDAVVDARVLHQDLRFKGEHAYHLLKLQMDTGEVFYTGAPENLRDLQGYTIRLGIRTDRIDFLGFMQSFYAAGRIIGIEPERSSRQRLGEAITNQHTDEKLGRIFGALIVAMPMESELREILSKLGISHLLAISGFHLGVLGFMLYWCISPAYRYFQERCFPYRHGRRDIFLLTAVILFAYLAFLDYVPSLVRAFGMLVAGYLFHDRGLKLFSMQSLFIVVVLLIAGWPRLAFSLGFWLSVGGVFSILLFIHHFSHWKKHWQFLAIHGWVYLMMLPVSLTLFGHFSLWHPLSILWTMLFIPFYPMELCLHLIGMGSLLDWGLGRVMVTGSSANIALPFYLLLLQGGLALLAIRFRLALVLLVGMVFAVFVGAVYQVA